MHIPAPHAPTRLLFTLFALAGGLLASGCEADLETVCHAGPCAGTGAGPDTTSPNGGSGGAGGGMMCPADPQTGDIPCAVHAVLEARCITCHNADHVNGANIDLLACERFHETDCDNQGTRLAKTRKYIESGFMPIGPDLTADEKQILLDWLDACAPCDAAGSGCGDPPGAKACYEQ
jgi:hypothetical protein